MNTHACLGSFRRGLLRSTIICLIITAILGVCSLGDTLIQYDARESALSQWDVFEIQIFERDQTSRGRQQGWFVSDDMLITAAHGVLDCGEIAIGLPNDSKATAKIWRIDEQLDIAWLKCLKPPEARVWSVTETAPAVGSDVHLITAIRQSPGQVLAVRASLFDGPRIETTIGSIMGDSGAVLIQNDRVVGVVTSLRRGVRGRLAAATPVTASMMRVDEMKAGDFAVDTSNRPRTGQAKIAGVLASKGKHGEAIKLYGELFAENKLDAREIYSYCYELIDAARWSELERILDVWNPRDQDLWLFEYMSGMVCAATGQPNEAIPHVQKSLELHKTTDTYEMICDLLEQTNRDQECESLIDEAKQNGHSGGGLLCILSRIRAKNGRPDEALQLAREAYGQDRRAPVAGRLAEALWDSGLKEEACEVAAGLIDRPDITYSACTSAGYVLWKSGRRDEAVGFFRTAVEVDPRQPDGWAHLGRIEAALRNRVRAIDALEQSLKLAENPEVMRDLCLLYHGGQESASYDRTLERLRLVSPEWYQKVVDRVNEQK